MVFIAYEFALFGNLSNSVVGVDALQPLTWSLLASTVAAAIAFAIFVWYANSLFSANGKSRRSRDKERHVADRVKATMEACEKRPTPDHDLGESVLGWNSMRREAFPHIRPQQDGREVSLGQGKVVLIADDDLIVVQALSRRLQKLGFQTLRSPDAAHALMGTMKAKPDLVVMDVNMPNGNGLAVCEMLASDPEYSHIPVIVHSCISNEETKRRCQQLGAIYIEKSPRSWLEIQKVTLRLLGDGGIGSLDGSPQETAESEEESPVAAAPIAASVEITASVEPVQVETDSGDSPEALEDISPRETDVKSEESVLEAASEVINAVRGAVHPASGLKIMCIDGTEDGQMTQLQRQLESSGVIIAVASGMAEGYYSCFSENPDVVVIQTPNEKKPTLDVLRRFADNERTRNLPTLLVDDYHLLNRDDVAPFAHAKILPEAISWKDFLVELAIAGAEKNKVETQAAYEAEGAKMARAKAAKEKAGAEGTAKKESPFANAKPNIKILCIDDDPVVTKSIAMRLKPYGIDVAVSHNGTQGYVHAIAERPDVILLDMYMPNGDGTYVIGKLKDHPITKNIPIVVVSHEKHVGVRREMLSLGASAYLTKPVQWEQFFLEISHYVDLPDRVLTDFKLSASTLS